MKAWKLAVVFAIVAIAPSARSQVPGSAIANLERLLAQQQWQAASHATWKILNPRGENTAELDPFPCATLENVDRLWTAYSNGHYGFSTQWDIWQDIAATRSTTTDNSESVWLQFYQRIGWDNTPQEAIAAGTRGYFPISEWWLTGEILTFGCGDYHCTIPRTTVEETVPAWDILQPRWQECN